jgi:hypothetical protein
VSIDRDDRWDDDRGRDRDRWDDDGRGRGGRRGGGVRPTGPGVALLLSGIVSLIVAVLVFVVYVLMLDYFVDFMRQQEKQAAGAQQQQLRDQIRQIEQNKAQVQMIYGVVGAVGAVLSVVIILGALGMMKAKNYGLALTASILSLIPVTNCCCFVATPIGIWALVSLLSPDVKAAFRARPAATEEL